MKIVLTGSSGFLGHHTYNEPLQFGHDILPLNRMKAEHGARKEIVTDLREIQREDLFKICKDAKAIIYLESLVDFT